jgi:cell division protein FtsI (penicillin-binding protein 3)
MTGERQAREAPTSEQAQLRWVRLRIHLAMGLFALMLLAIGHRAFGLQLLHGEKYHRQARQQTIQTLKLSPKRGAVLDRHNTRLAVSVDVPSVYANPRQVGDAAPEAARRLAAILDADRYLLTERLSSRRYYAWIKRRVTPRQARQVARLGYKGIFLTRETRRFYPNRRLAGAVIGFAGLDGRGLEGVEKHFDSWLRGSSSSISGLRDAHGKPVYIEGRPDLTPSAGHIVVLTIDKKLQFITENALRRTVELYQAKGGTAVVMDPYSGDILALASAPDFDPNNFGASDPEALRNRAVTDAYEPGSTMKVFTMAAAFQHRVVRLEEQIYCENGMIEIGKHKIKDSHPHKWLSLTGCIQKSSNICITKVAQRLGKRRLYTALRLFGFGHKTGVLLPGERSGHLDPWRRWSEAKLSNVSFGQGMTATTVQLAAALGALANGGLLYRPRIALEIRDANGRPVVQYRKRKRRVVSALSARRVLTMMRTVVEPGGTGEEAALDGYSVAGKTGTAQKVAATSVKRAKAQAEAAARAALQGRPAPKKRTAGYADDLYLASFMGVVPASRPRLVIVVTVDEPKERYYGGEVAGPIFKEIAEQAVRYLGVPRDQALDVKKKKRAPRPSSPQAEREPPVEPAPALPVSTPGGPRFTMPDFTGLSMAAVLTRARKLGLRCGVTGTGRAVRQQPPPGTASRRTRCQVAFAPPG